MPIEAQSTPSLTLRKPWPQVGSLVVISVAVLGLVIALLSLQLNWDSAVIPCQLGLDPNLGQCGDFTGEEAQALTLIEISLANIRTLNTIYTLISILIFYGVAGLILLRRSDTWLGLLTALWLVVIGAQSFSGNYFVVIAEYPVLQIPIALLNGASLALLIPFLALFPNGHFVPRWTKLLVIISLPFLLFGNSLYFFTGFLGVLPIMGLWVSVGSIVLGFAAQTIRYRKVSNPTERQQTKLVLIGMGLLCAAVIVLVTFLVFSDKMSPAGLAIGNLAITLVFFIGILSIPVTVGFSMLRYRLWDIDVLIRRTLVYGVLTITLGLVFFGFVALMQALFQAVSGQQSAISVVISTLVISALFNPLRRRVQDLIDRRFYRKKYNAEQALNRFNNLARSVTDVEQLSAEILAVVQETMQPEKVSLWIRPASGMPRDKAHT